MKKSLILFFLLFLAFPLQIYSEEEESLDLIYQKIRYLEQEIATLRNFIEENSYLIERYQEIQQQRYLDLDKRLHNILTGELEELSEQSVSFNDINSSDELCLYKEALELFDVSRYSEALETFRNLIVSFPEGVYSADAYFWSGELYLVQEQFEDARENYLVVVEKFKEHSRVADCLYKLGVLEHILMNNEIANSYFTKVITEFPDTGAAELAKKSMKTSIQESN